MAVRPRGSVCAVEPLVVLFALVVRLVWQGPASTEPSGAAPRKVAPHAQTHPRLTSGGRPDPVGT
jgi:hypothetical protein